MATRTRFADVVAQLEGLPAAVRGARFEELMVEFFRQDPTLRAEYDVVERWPEWPHNEHSHDVGIDVVARRVETGEWTAIQCKFYDPSHQLAKQDIDSFFTASGKTWDGVEFTNRIIISTTDHWTSHAEEALEAQTIPVQRIGLAQIAESPIDWMRQPGTEVFYELKPAVKYGLRPHQKEAIEKILAGFQTHDRGTWVSACGTGKTFTSLRLAEQMCETNGGRLKVLFLAPSISLVSQSLTEWMGQTHTTIRPFVVCSDTKAGRKAEDITIHDIPLPTTDATRLAAELGKVPRRGRMMTVVFSTYQSIDVVAQAQQASREPFDVILCDEAHRTTGVTLTGQDESAFVKVHDNTYLPAAKRLYMTATPRIYGDQVKQKADEASAVLASMDDETLFGPEFHRLGFGEAVEQGLLSDYKVMILVVDNQAIAEPLQAALANSEHEISLDDAAKIVGCWNGLAKHTRDLDFGPHPVPMKRAVAFARSIAASNAFKDMFPRVVDTLTSRDPDNHDSRDPVGPTCEVHHVDGTMNALHRANELAWLKAPIPDGECRILSNARCLAEGVDVPALDAVMFLNPRNSIVDVVQSVGRVMRKADGKDYGYIILPVAVPADLDPEQAMRDNTRFKVVWDVLNALRAHDERFNAMINTIQLNHDTSGRIGVDIIGTGAATDTDGTDTLTSTRPGGFQPMLPSLAEWRDSILARIVLKCGDRQYWDTWAKDVAAIHTNQVTRIHTILDHADPVLASQFDRFLAGLRANLNDSISPDDAIGMLSQHLLTEPVFDALFSQNSFARQNPVAQTMQHMVDALAGQGLDAETAPLDGFYQSVHRRAAGITTPEGRQQVIHDLYEQFFKNAFPKQASSLGVVYTPIPIVDFIIRAADQACHDHLGYRLTDPNVHILDPFTGTGTFIVRLLQSGTIRPEDLPRKYANELWANEIMLLAYYIACVNIETTYQALQQKTHPDQTVDYTPFPGATLTDTFQITENSDKADTSLIPVNNTRIETELAAPIKVILGNPPYSAGQDSANDNNANLSYPTLDARIDATYAARSSARLRISLHDSYIRAFRWATDRLGDTGVLAYVTNNGWIDGNAASGVRLTFTDDFADVYLYNLRGNQRTAGELSRQEGGKVFGSGSRAGVAIMIAIRQPHTGPCHIHYHQVADYLTREEKLDTLDGADLHTIPWQTITPNQDGDWLNQRHPTFDSYPPLGVKDTTDRAESYFTLHSNGLKTNRDAWCYNYSRSAVETNMTRMIDFYNQQATTNQGDKNNLSREPTRISWSRGLENDAIRGIRQSFKQDRVYEATYRPFTKQYAYFDRPLNDMVYRLNDIFPTPHHHNIGIECTGAGLQVPFSCLASTNLVDVQLLGNGQFFPRWRYVTANRRNALPMADDTDEWGYRRVDNITDRILTRYQQTFGPQVTKDDIFCYVYAVLHSEQYRTLFAPDLKRMLPHIPLAASRADFETFVDAGRRLLHLHVDYETIDPYPLAEEVSGDISDPWRLYQVDKMRWTDKTKKTTLTYNTHVTLHDIPEAAHRYMLGSRSALDWILDRYQIRTDKPSGIVNDPNDWAREHHQPRYIIDLIGRITRISITTMTITDHLPELPLT